MAFEPSIYVVEPIGCSYLAVMARPVLGEWIKDEFAGIAAFGIKRVVSLLEADEATEIGLGDERALCEENGMEFLSYPIIDRGLPSSLADFSQFTLKLYETISGGQATVLHCRAGIGRTGIMAAGVLLIGYVLIFTVLDHWVIQGGFSSGTRLAMLMAACFARP